MPISTLWAKSMPSMFSRKPWTKCWRDCSPSVTMSTPASSCSFTASTVASRLARASSEPLDFQGAHSVLGSASHSGFGSEPAIVVGNSMSAYPPWFLDWMVYLPGLICHVLSVAYMAFERGGMRRKQGVGLSQSRSGSCDDRPSLCADAERLENLDHAGGNRPPLHGVPRGHTGRRPVQTRFSGDQSEQSHSGH